MMLQGIQALIHVMRSDYLDSNISTPGEVRSQNDLAVVDDISKTVISDSNSMQRACDTRIDKCHGTRTQANMALNESAVQTMQPATPVYTVLTSKDKSYPTVPDTRNSGINKSPNSTISSTSSSLPLNSVIPQTRPHHGHTGPLSHSTVNPTRPSTIHKTPSTPNSAGPTSNVVLSVGSNPDPVVTGPNKPSPANEPSCYLMKWTFQKVRAKNSNGTPSARRELKPANSMLNQLLRRSIPSTSQPQSKSPHCLPILPKFPTTERPQHHSSTRSEDCRTKSDVKASKRRDNRQEKSANKPVESFASHESSCCDECLSDVEVHLAKEELWKLFHEQENEMIVSKPGR